MTGLGNDKLGQSPSLPISHTAPSKTAETKNSRILPSPTSTARGNGALRSVDSAFKVNPINGTLTLDLPISTTVGRGSMSPELALNYDSGSGNGPFGVGWQLSIDSVTLKTSKRIPKYDGSDVYQISDAEELVPEKELNGVIAEFTKGDFQVRKYRPRIENQRVRIERWTSVHDSSDVHWRTISSASQTTIYGLTEDSRIWQTDDTGRKLIFSWLKCQTYDAVGNSMVFEFKAEDLQGLRDGEELERFKKRACPTRYLKSIKYGNQRPNRSLKTWEVIESPMEWLFETVFDYGDHDRDAPKAKGSKEWLLRPDRFSSWKSGFEIRTQRLCQRVLMFHHMKDKLDEDDVLVASTEFGYDFNSAGTTLVRCTTKGHSGSYSKGYTTQELPSFSFEYTKLPAFENLVPDVLSVPGLSSSGSSTPTAQWIDLEGEGTTGLLRGVGKGGWSYERNMLPQSTKDVEFSSGSGDLIPSQPSLWQDERMWYLEDLDRNGVLDLVCLDPLGRLQGFYERSSNGWKDFTPFSTIPNLKLDEQSAKRIDLTGSGLADLLIINEETSEIAWRECLAKDGFSDEKCLGRVANGPQILKGDPTSALFLADMSGDGLADIVQISNSSVKYWPNAGYGRFEAEIIMQNSPILDTNQRFIPERLRLVDIDGSGTSDLLYFPEIGGVNVYSNFCGNLWSDKKTITSFPTLDKLSSISTLDLLGVGTACLCWTGYDATRPEDSSLYYIDLTTGSKPHALVSYSNGYGASTTVKYRSSTSFYLDDEKNGTPWTTKVPFPIHCVSEVTAFDAISRNKTITRYAYHDGYYDGFEQEFRGFGMVEQWDSEEHGTQTQPYSQPPVHKKQWYATGSSPPAQKLPRAFEKSTLLWPSTKPAPETQGDIIVRDIEEERDMNRAWKGTKLREEIFSADGSAKSLVPFSTMEFSSHLIQLQARGENQPGIYRLVPRETVSRTYDRILENPRIEHNMILDVDSFANVLRSVSISYGCAASALAEADDREKQQQTFLTYNESVFTNAIGEKDNGARFRGPLLASSKTQRILGVPTPKGLLDFEDVKKNDYNFITSIPEVPFHDEATPKLAARKVLLSESRTFYTSGDLKKPLLLGKLEEFSVVSQSFQLAFDGPLLNKVYGTNGKICSTDGDEIIKAGGYQDLDNDGRLWQPSSIHRFDDDPAQELAAARASFYLPISEVDVFGEAHHIVYDCFKLLPIINTDPLGNTINTEYDYRSLQPIDIKDENDNHQLFAYDPLGRLTATAVTAKSTDALGDSLASVKEISIDDIEAFRRDPYSSTSISLLASASTRSIYGSPNIQDSGHIIPAFEATISRTVHASDKKSLDISEITLQLTYLDGSGSPIQHVNLHDGTLEGIKWRFSGWEVHNNKGNIVRVHQPSIRDTHQFHFEANVGSPANTTLYDSLDRVVGILNANHTWAKTVTKAWLHTKYDEGDTILTDPTADTDISQYFSKLDSSLYSPSWLVTREGDKTAPVWEKDAAVKSKTYADRPDTYHVNALGQTILTVSDIGGRNIIKRMVYDDAGNLLYHVDGLERKVEKAQYDYLRRVLHNAGMDDGEIWIFPDCHGKTVIEENSRQIATMTTYDALERPDRVFVTAADGVKRLVTEYFYGEDLANAQEKNLKNKLVRVADQSGASINTLFDFKGNCLSTSRRFAKDYRNVLDWTDGAVPLEEESFKTETVYDALSRVAQSTDSNGHTTKRTYGISGHLKAVLSHGKSEKDWTANISNIQYDADGLPLQVNYGNGVTRFNEYDKFTRSLRRRRTVSSSKEILEDITYTLDCRGQITNAEDKAQKDVYFRNDKISASTSYTYDTLGRLIKTLGREQIDVTTGNAMSAPAYTSSSSVFKRKNISTTSQTMCNYEEVYEYDDAGNILNLQHTPVSDATVAGWSRKYDYLVVSLIEPGKMGNRLSETCISKSTHEFYGYDGEAGKVGCMTSMPGYSSLAWNFGGKLQSSSTQVVKNGTPETTYYVYDHTGSRLRKVTESASNANGPPVKLKETLYLSSAEVLRKYSVNSGMEEIWTSQVIGSTKIVALVETQTQPVAKAPLIRYRASDSLELDDEGKTISYEEYSPFGATTFVMCSSRVSAPSKYRYAAYERDEETGLMYCDARYYAPWLGRWISPDPIGTADSDNLYCYVDNNPLSATDPSGLMKKTTAFNFPSGSGDKRSKSPSKSNLPSLGKSASRGPSQDKKAVPTKGSTFKSYSNLFPKDPPKLFQQNQNKQSLFGASGKGQGDLSPIKANHGLELRGRAMNISSRDLTPSRNLSKDASGERIATESNSKIGTSHTGLRSRGRSLKPIKTNPDLPTSGGKPPTGNSGGGGPPGNGGDGHSPAFEDSNHSLGSDDSIIHSQKDLDIPSWKEFFAGAPEFENKIKPEHEKTFVGDAFDMPKDHEHLAIVGEEHIELGPEGDELADRQLLQGLNEFMDRNFPEEAAVPIDEMSLDALDRLIAGRNAEETEAKKPFMILDHQDLKK